jgi:carbon monoxide dehydrogenase subunit G
VSSIEVSTEIDASPAEVWAEVGRIDRHVDWMLDAESITFTSATTSGTGTTFDCVTKVGPIRLVDKMEITEWRDGEVMGVRHKGVVTGSGRFTLEATAGGHTRFTWVEDLVFPWWMGGPVGGVVGGRIMKLVWRRNLSKLKRRIESAG